jgi:hypothetical protein
MSVEELEEKLRNVLENIVLTGGKLCKITLEKQSIQDIIKGNPIRTDVKYGMKAGRDLTELAKSLAELAGIEYSWLYVYLTTDGVYVQVYCERSDMANNYVGLERDYYELSDLLQRVMPKIEQYNKAREMLIYTLERMLEKVKS